MDTFFFFERKATDLSDKILSDDVLLKKIHGYVLVIGPFFHISRR